MGPAIVRFPRRHVDPNAVYELVMRERSADGRHGSSIPFSFRARLGFGLTNARVAESGWPEGLGRRFRQNARQPCMARRHARCFKRTCSVRNSVSKGQTIPRYAWLLPQRTWVNAAPAIEVRHGGNGLCAFKLWGSRSRQKEIHSARPLQRADPW